MKKMAAVITVTLMLFCLSGASSKCIPSRPTGTLIPNTPAVIEAFMKCHRDAREEAATHAMGIEVMHWSQKIADFAALTIRDCQFSHTDGPCRQNRAGFANVGENIAAQSMRGGGDAKAAADMCQRWVDEINYYNSYTGKCQSGKACGHYTQIVWSKTTHVGCAMVNCNPGVFGGSMETTSATCQYGPAGNFMGQLALPAPSGACASPTRCGDQGHGRCFLTGSGMECHCEDGYTHTKPNDKTSKCVKGSSSPSSSPSGEKHCKANSCNNHGACIEDSSKALKYRCDCSTGWDGTKCDHQKGNCNPSVNCNGHGTCTGNGGCKCNAGYTGNTCGLISNGCTSKPCHQGGTCQNLPGGKFKCNCGKDWTGPTCDTPAGGHWTDRSGIWGTMRDTIDQYRARYGMVKLDWSMADVKDAKADAKVQGCKMSEDGHKGAHGTVLFHGHICGDPSKMGNYGQWFANYMISSNACVANKQVINAGCAIAPLCKNTPCLSSNTMATHTCACGVAHSAEFEGNKVQYGAQVEFPQSVESSNISNSVVVGVAISAVVAIAAVIAAVILKKRHQTVDSVEASYEEL